MRDAGAGTLSLTADGASTLVRYDIGNNGTWDLEVLALNVSVTPADVLV